MKRLSFIVMAGLIALGLTQCKKNEPTNNDTEGVKITLNINNGNGGGRMHIEEETSTTTGNPIVKVNYDENDVIYVCSNGSYVGYLYCTSADPDGSTFTGTISSSASTSHPLQFIYLGGDTRGVNRDSEFNNITTGSFTFSLADQSAGIAVVSTALSKENFSTATTSYTLAGNGKMRNKCALVKFTFQVGGSDLNSTDDVTITDAYNQLNIGFDGSVSTITSNGKGNIATFESTSNPAVHYAVVPSQQELSGYVDIEGYEGTYSIPAADDNGFIQKTINLTAETPAGFEYKPFTVGDGKVVNFSPGNAHFHPSTGWSFAGEQYDYEQTWNSNSNVSHFAWGTWSNNNPSVDPNVTGMIQYGMWGAHQLNTNGDFYMDTFDGTFPVSVSIAEETGWRVMTQEEWDYLLNTRTVNNGRQPYGFGKVTKNDGESVNGLIILPDDWDGSADRDFQYGTISGWPNVYTEAKWFTMESKGAVFLPAAGYRMKGASTNSTINYYHSAVEFCNVRGGYWTITPFGNDRAYLMYFDNQNGPQTNNTNWDASFGFCVRFVKAAN